MYIARVNNIHVHLLYLHILRTSCSHSMLDFFSKACSQYPAPYPGTVVTNDRLPSLVSQACPHSFTAVLASESVVYSHSIVVKSLTDKLHP